MQCTGPMHPRLLPRLWGKGLWWVHAGEMGRERSSVLLEITIAMLRAEEHKALLGNWLFFPSPPPRLLRPHLLRGAAEDVGPGGCGSAPGSGGSSVPPVGSNGVGISAKKC